MSPAPAHLNLLFHLLLKYILLYRRKLFPRTVLDLQQCLAHFEGHRQGHGEVFRREQLQRAVQASRDGRIGVRIGKGCGEVGRGSRGWGGRGWVDGRWEEDPFFGRGRWGSAMGVSSERCENLLYSPLTDAGRAFDDEEEEEDDDVDADAMAAVVMLCDQESKGKPCKVMMDMEMRWMLMVTRFATERDQIPPFVDGSDETRVNSAKVVRERQRERAAVSRAVNHIITTGTTATKYMGLKQSIA